MTLAESDGRGAQPEGISAPPSGQSQAAKAACRDQRHLRPQRKQDQEAAASQSVTRFSMDGKATVQRGEVSRGGLTRGDHQACDHDLGLQEKDVPCGIVDEERGQLPLTCGSSYKTRDFLVAALEAWGAALEETEQGAMARLQINMDHGPASSGKRPQFLYRMVEFCDAIGKPMPLLYSPPYHSKYHPIERCWGILE